MFLNLFCTVTFGSCVELTSLTTEVLLRSEFESVTWEVWQRAAMGLKPLPYQAARTGDDGDGRIKKGYLGNLSHPFRWDEVCMNLPGVSDYNPGLHWVSKIQLGDDNIMCDIIIFVDDLRVTGPSKAECSNAGQRVAQVLNHLGLQDAPQK
jgi:hypothetical protein